MSNYEKYADEMLNKITRCVQEQLKHTPQIETAIVKKVNLDGTVNISLPTSDRNTVFTRISNQTPFTLTVGDTVEVIKKTGSWNNCWIIAKHEANSK